MFYIGTVFGDIFDGSALDDVIDGGDGDDTLNGLDGNDLIYGGNGIDQLVGGNGVDQLYGEDGNDRLDGGAGADMLDGGIGFDYATYWSATAGVRVDLASGGLAGDAAGDRYVSIEGVYDSAYDDVVFGDAGGNAFVSGSGNDRIDGRGGVDRYSTYDQFDSNSNAYVGLSIGFGTEAQNLLASIGVNNVVLPAGAAVSVREFSDRVEYDILTSIQSFDGTRGNDKISGDGLENLIRPSGGSDTLDGGAGYDYVSYSLNLAPVTVDLAAGTAAKGDAQVDALARFEGIVGSADNDQLLGNVGNNRLLGREGGDALDGRAGNDQIEGQEGNDVLIGGSGTDLLDGGLDADLMDGGGGIDTVIYLGSKAGVHADLLLSRGSVLVDDGVTQVGGDSPGDRYINIENVRGSEHGDYLRGNHGANLIEGRIGDDELYGCDGNDTLYGDNGPALVELPTPKFPGFDVFVGVDECDCETQVDARTQSRAGEIDYTYADYLNGGDGDDRLYGQNGSDLLEGGCDRDTLDGGAGADLLYGGDQDDMLHGGAGFDFIFGGLGFDTASYSGSANGVRIDLAGVTPNFGGDASASLFQFIVEAAVDEAGGADAFLGGGLSALLLAFTAEAQDESFFHIGDLLFGVEAVGGSAFADTLRGNDLANGLAGSGGNDTLEGRGGNDTLDGGTGSDRLVGGPGNDQYVVGSGDTVVEASAQGTDTVTALVSYTLGNHVERLVLGGSAALNGTGNTLDNLLTGNAATNRLSGGSGNDTLDGRGGTDVLAGGAGNDTYVLGDTKDSIVEALGAGTDRVLASVSVALDDHVEYLTLTGSAAINGTGNGLANRLTGNAAANVLSGGAGGDTIGGGAGNDWLVGGTGDDLLTGGSGNDVFRFVSAPNAATNVDRITDFSPVADTIQIENAVFLGVGPAGALAAGAFRPGRAAADSSDRVIYDAGSGRLLYDGDGAGGSDAVLFATVAPGTALTAADFAVI